MTNNDNNQKRAGAKRPWEFLAVFLAVFFLISVLLFAIDFVPETPSAGPAQNIAAKEIPAPVLEVQYPIEEPVKIAIASIGVDIAIENPATTDLKALDEELLKGAVRYPTSAKLGETGTVYLFGHQSYLPVVHNKAFKAFNDVQNLKAGDIITVSSRTAEYTYRVTTVTLTTASNGVIPLAKEGRGLILSTCNSISADHEQRYVVEADFVSRRGLDS
jgi:LPXTG-site transpeptidase (sortase) family protein